ncbi:hypothetical protein [Arthrobacter sp. ISL-30]|uniref:hypothetical protein n=1 Tax=Arthrobacter sp. ISL-30 TaxID=2819109 RepID=UPI001BE6FFE1|nr:hypothetical protein [Arthrobacter sp. ISL-30]MBT2512534.1 hypothetical protein [Arthrobacter sp. ISL-30]
MVNIPGLINSLLPQDLDRLQQQGPDQVLDLAMVEAIDRAAGGPGEGRGYYVVKGSLEPRELRNYYLREDVAAALFTPGPDTD